MSTSWSNWLGNHRAHLHAVETPSNVDEVSRAIDRARARRQSVRVLGAGFAWSPLIPVEGCLISSAKLDAVRHIDRARCQLTVEAGAKLAKVVEVAAAHGMSVKSTSMFLGLSVGGLIATGSHGTGRNSATFGDGVVGFEMVKADGTVLDVTAPGSELWRAMITNLGALGMVTAVTLQCEPLYNVHEHHIQVHISEVPALLPRMLADYEFVSLFWHPSSPWAVFKLGNRTILPAVDVKGRVNPTVLDHAVAKLGRFMPSIVKHIPFLREIIGNRIKSGIGTGSRVVSEPYFSHYQQAYPRVISSEFAIPQELASEAWTWLFGRLMQYWKANVRPVDLVVHARFTGASEAFLASAAGRPTCHLEVLCFEGNRQRDLFQGEFHRTMQDAFQGRPHWGKEIVHHWSAASCYGSNLELFLDIRHELDPGQRFLNPFLRDEVFGLGRRAVKRAASTG
jgi:FAD/FMN-containing dehydrogenase